MDPKPTKQLVITSVKGKLISQDWQRIGYDTLIFASPLILIFLVQLQAGKSPKEALLFVWAALLQILINLFKKLSTEKVYKVEPEDK